MCVLLIKLQEQAGNREISNQACPVYQCCDERRGDHQRLRAAHALEILACLFEKHRGGIISGDDPEEPILTVNNRQRRSSGERPCT